MSTKRIVLTALAAFVVLLGVVVYFTFDPSNPSLSKYFPKCPFYSLTGLKCPGCGTQRALHEIPNGDIAGAAVVIFILLYFLPYKHIRGVLLICRYPHGNNICNMFFRLPVWSEDK